MTNAKVASGGALGALLGMIIGACIAGPIGAIAVGKLFFFIGTRIADGKSLN